MFNGERLFLILVLVVIVGLLGLVVREANITGMSVDDLVVNKEKTSNNKMLSFSFILLIVGLVGCVAILLMYNKFH